MATTPATALISGGTSGIGRAAANKLAQLGIHVLLVGRNVERGEKAVDEIRAAGGKRILFHLISVTRRARAKCEKSGGTRKRSCRYSYQQCWDLSSGPDA